MPTCKLNPRFDSLLLGKKGPFVLPSASCRKPTDITTRHFAIPATRPEKKIPNAENGGISPPRWSALRDTCYDQQERSNQKEVGRLIIVRHGQSVWNVTDPQAGTTARFTGWADVGLTERGRSQASASGRALMSNFVDSFGSIDCAFCSLLSRSRETLDLSLKELGLMETFAHDQRNSRKNVYHIPIISSWRLNERHYGDLVGCSKEGAERLFGKKQLTQWRNSWVIPPPPMSHGKWVQWSKLPHCQMVTEVTDPVTHSPGAEVTRRVFLVSEKKSNSAIMPHSESMSDTYRRLLPLWEQAIVPRLRLGQNLLLVAHANSIRCLLHVVDPDNISRQGLKLVKIPSATPLVYSFRASDGALIPSNMKTTELSSGANDEMIHGGALVRGQWIKCEEIEDLSFCSKLGVNMGEQEIA